MSAAHCPICLNNYALDAEKFVIFPCGHGFCTECTSRLFSEPRPKCPHCRKVLHRKDAHPVYIDLVDPQTFLQTAVIEGLNQMGVDTPVVSVRKAGQKLSNALEGSSKDEDNLALLLKAVDDFKTRIAPIFGKAETQKQEIENLQNNARKLRRDKELLQTKLKKVEPLQIEICKLKSSLSEAERNTDEALRLAERAKDDLEVQHTAVNQWKKRATELEQENKRFKDLLDRHTNNARLQKEKNRKLSKEVSALKEKMEEREPMSAMSQDYDGDFSAHEYSKVHLESSFRLMSATPSRAHRYSLNKVELDMEGMPPPNFPSEWQLEDRPGVLKKRNLNGTLVEGQRRVAGSFPISLDRKGHPTRAVQLGPKSIIHVGR